ncbi:30S ribosomal protein S20 [Coxiella endosymbiont of Amblyomma americanum]|uniref:30S ribosomal protein S20 n=1 Tax=Coxiella endosymbiont of Amblyomma americanum TaxID=325775 RepID=UPI00057C3AD1|nr:30S ribosomal protein S20 [Coxiella endosymbiont of Amblyomma americanum]AJC50483.1 SSU ribosomal protein S20P [Coxiella endosymbiont of Amblyomma americanum]AUJ58822.1 30S ribosomal protein S20 [Coxiella-like endosymbiont of Amblyomma americanum]
MANSLQAMKRVRQNKRRQLRNASKRSSVRTIIKKTLQSLQQLQSKGEGLSTSSSAMQSISQKAFQLLDRAARKRIVHANRVNRLKVLLSAKSRIIKGLKTGIPENRN